MKYFNGFCLRGEEVLLKEYLRDDKYSVAGFSYGAQKAFDYVYESNTRIERLILLSPAFFQTQKPSFKRIQLRYFDEGKEAYIKQFLSNVTYPASASVLDPYFYIESKDDLEALLAYEWDIDKIEEVLARGTKIEIFVGAKDKIVDSDEILAFFAKTACVSYRFKALGHILNS